MFYHPPRAAPQDNQRFFYSDATCQRTLVNAAWRSLDAIFTRSGVTGAHPHRFRHTLASEVLGKGGSLEKVAGIPGDSVATIRRYDAKGRNRTGASFSCCLPTTLRDCKIIAGHIWKRSYGGREKSAGSRNQIHTDRSSEPALVLTPSLAFRSRPTSESIAVTSA
jgi:hypothetical protein